MHHRTEGLGTSIPVLSFFPQATPSSKASPQKRRRRRTRLGSKKGRRRRRTNTTSESSTEEGEGMTTPTSDSESETFEVKLPKSMITPPAPKREKLSPLVLQESKDEPSETAVAMSMSPSTPSNSLSPDRHKKRKRIPYTLVEASKGNHCPTPGCDGVGHITGLYAMHFAVSGCPRAHGKTPEECRARREELNRLRSKNLPPPEVAEEGPVVRRTSRTGGGGGGGGSGSMGVAPSLPRKSVVSASNKILGSRALKCLYKLRLQCTSALCPSVTFLMRFFYARDYWSS